MSDARTKHHRVSDERLAALIQYGAPGGLAPHDFALIVCELQERRAQIEKPPTLKQIEVRRWIGPDADNVATEWVTLRARDYAQLGSRVEEK